MFAYDQLFIDIYNICAVSQILHNASLIIDDIQDQSIMRRGQPCTYLKYGQDLSINAGNFLYFYPFTKNIIQQSDYKLHYQFNEIVFQELTNLHFGQNWDIMWNQKVKNNFVPSVEQYIQMISNKTAIIPRLLVRLLSVVINLKQEQISHGLIQYSQNIGIAFQIRDDILDLTEGQFSKGKNKVGQDITEGKKTLIVILTYSSLIQKGKKQQADQFLRIINSGTSDSSKISQCIQIMQKQQAIKRSQQFSQQIIIKSWSKLQNILQKYQETNQITQAKQNLKSIAQYLINRQI